MEKKTLLASMAIMMALSGVACSERTQEAARETTQSAARDTERNVERTGQAMESTTERASEAAQNAVQTAVWTAKVKNALYADEKIAAYRLNVDSDGTENHVTITGTVPTAAEKERITRIAKKTLGANAVIENRVKVTAR